MAQRKAPPTRSFFLLSLVPSEAQLSVPGSEPTGRTRHANSRVGSKGRTLGDVSTDERHLTFMDLGKSHWIGGSPRSPNLESTCLKRCTNRNVIWQETGKERGNKNYNQPNSTQRTTQHVSMVEKQKRKDQAEKLQHQI